jgi:Leucine-rich repeat (LRR) protein
MNPSRWPSCYTRRQCHIGLLCALLVTSGLWAAEEKNAAQEEAVAVIQKMKGFVVTDKDRPGKPVTEVHLYAGKTAGIGLAPLEKLPEIEWIGLHDSDISEAELDHLKGLTKLRRLGLAHLKLDDASLKRIEDIATIEILFLMENPITDAGLDHLRKMTKLKELGLGQTKVADAGMVQVAAFKDLQTLGLQELKITDSGLERLKVLTRLQKLDLTHCNQLRNLKPLQGLPLVSLNLFGCRMVQDLRPLAGAPLTDLDLGGTQVADLSPLRGMKLARLNLSQTPVTDLSPLGNCKDLKSLRLQGTKVTAAEIAALQKALPNCKIEQ